MQHSSDTPDTKVTIVREASLDDDKRAINPATEPSDTLHLLCDPSNADVSPFTLLEVYQPLNGRRYDLTNTFDRTNISIRISAAIQDREGRLESVEWMYRKGLISSADYLERRDEARAQLRRHRSALNQLGQLGSY